MHLIFILIGLIAKVFNITYQKTKTLFQHMYFFDVLSGPEQHITPEHLCRCSSSILNKLYCILKVEGYIFSLHVFIAVDELS